MHKKGWSIDHPFFVTLKKRPCYSSVNGVNWKRVTSNRPWSLSFSSGITKSAMKESVREIEVKLNNVSDKSDSIMLVKDELIKVVQSLSATAQENAAVSEEVCASAETVGKDVEDMSERLSEIDVICDNLENVAVFFGKN